MLSAPHVTIHRLSIHDHLEAHSAHTLVVRLLNGHPSRALWRLETPSDLIILTGAPLQIRSLGARLQAHASKPYLPQLQGGEQVQFRVRLHPVKRWRDAQRIERLRICQDDEIPAFFEPKALQHGFRPLAYDLRRERGQIIEQQQRRITLPSADFFGTLEVLDAETFHATLLQGIGKKRTFGFGLLQIARG